jgi:hypothetical protein
MFLPTDLTGRNMPAIQQDGHASESSAVAARRVAPGFDFELALTAPDRLDDFRFEQFVQIEREFGASPGASVMPGS